MKEWSDYTYPERKTYDQRSIQRKFNFWHCTVESLDAKSKSHRSRILSSSVTTYGLILDGHTIVHINKEKFDNRLTCYFIVILVAVKSLIFCDPTKSRKYSSKTTPFCFLTESCDIYPGRLDISWPLIFFRMVQYTFEKCEETPSRSAIGRCSYIPDLKEDLPYNLLTMIGQWHNKDINDS